MNPQDILSNVTGLLQNAQQASAQAQTHQQEISQALTGAVRELTAAVRALTAVAEALAPLLAREKQQDVPVLTLTRPRTG